MTEAENAEVENPHAESVRKLAGAMLRTAISPGLITVVAAAVIATVFAGTAGLLGALVGGAVAFASSLLTIVMMRESADLPVMMVMAIALGGYVFKILALLIVMILLRGVEGLHTMSLALTVLVTVMVWAGAELVAFKKTKIPTIVVTGQ